MVSADINVQKRKGTAVWRGETKVILSFFLNTWSKNKGSPQPSYCQFNFYGEELIINWTDTYLIQ